MKGPIPRGARQHIKGFIPRESPWPTSQLMSVLFCLLLILCLATQFAIATGPLLYTYLCLPAFLACPCDSGHQPLAVLACALPWRRLLYPDWLSCVPDLLNSVCLPLHTTSLPAYAATVRLLQGVMVLGTLAAVVNVATRRTAYYCKLS